MRITLNDDDHVLASARALAAERGISVDAALSELARRSLRARPVATERSVPGFAVDPDGPLITPEMVRAANEDS
ncbi:MAG: antitoxin [Acidobacteria bacterium]|nr:antitoxin [Acidobacteriota bacterium]